MVHGTHRHRIRVVEEALLDPANGCYGVNIPAGQGHSIEVMASDMIWCFVNKN
jgi:hypothetical protein